VSQPELYWIMLHVRLRAQIFPGLIGDHDKPIDGYYKSFGVTASNESEAKEIALSAIQDGAVDWTKSEISLVEPERLAPDILARCKDWRKKGIWYKTGRALYSDDPQEAPESQQ
jgi:hypothetical protein